MEVDQERLTRRSGTDTKVVLVRRRGRAEAAPYRVHTARDAGKSLRRSDDQTLEHGGAGKDRTRRAGCDSCHPDTYGGRRPS